MEYSRWCLLALRGLEDRIHQLDFFHRTKARQAMQNHLPVEEMDAKAVGVEADTDNEAALEAASP